VVSRQNADIGDTLHLLFSGHPLARMLIPEPRHC